MAQRGVDKLLSKIKDSMSSGRYYEAHQIYRTIFFRLSNQKRYLELANILLDGAEQLINHKQFQSGSDLTLILIEVLSSCELEGNKMEFDKWIETLARLVEKIEPNVVERETIIVKAVKFSAGPNNQKNPLMHKLLARVMAKEQNYEQARYHYLLSKDGVGCAKILIQLSAKALISEVDMILVQVVLNLLVLNEKSTALETFDYYTKYHPKIRTYQPPFRTPLLNFAYFLLNIIDEKKLQAFTTLCELYKTALDRDPAYKQQIEKIGVSYFNAPVKKQQQGGGLFGNFFNQLFQELEGDSDSDNDNENFQPSQQANRFTSSSVDLD